MLGQGAIETKNESRPRHGPDSQLPAGAGDQHIKYIRSLRPYPLAQEESDARAAGDIITQKSAIPKHRGREPLEILHRWTREDLEGTWWALQAESCKTALTQGSRALVLS